jgi:hypothetical protein
LTASCSYAKLNDWVTHNSTRKVQIADLSLEGTNEDTQSPAVEYHPMACPLPLPSLSILLLRARLPLPLLLDAAYSCS